MIPVGAGMKGDATMKQKTPTEQPASTVCCEMIETRARERIQSWLQDLLEEEVTEFLGRAKSQRRAEDDVVGYRNGYGKPRRIALSSGTVNVRRPRLRNLGDRFESRVLPLFKRRSQELGAMLPRLYLHGLSSGDFEPALRGRQVGLHDYVAKFDRQGLIAALKEQTADMDCAA